MTDNNASAANPMTDSLFNSPALAGAGTVPYNEDAEKAVLGCCLAGQDVLASIVPILQENDFYLARHRLIYRAILGLVADHLPVDVLTLADRLGEKKQLEAIGTIAYLDELANAPRVVANAETYAKSVQSKAVMRQLQTTLKEILLLSKDSDDAYALMDMLLAKLINLGKATNQAGLEQIWPIINETLNNLKELDQSGNKFRGIKTSLPSLDLALGGLKAGSLNILAARPAMGKSALAINIAHNVAYYSNLPVAIFSLEMSKQEIAIRLLSAFRFINSADFNQPPFPPEFWQKLSDAAFKYYKIPIYIDDRPGISPLEILSKARQLKMERGLGLIVIDYLQLMRSDGKNDSRQQDVSEMSRNLKLLAKELEVPVIALSQLSRACEARQNRRPVLSDLRESGSIEQDADTVMFIYRDSYYTEKEQGITSEEKVSEAEVIIAKNRHGKTTTVKLNWMPDYTLFTETVDEANAPRPSNQQDLELPEELVNLPTAKNGSWLDNISDLDATAKSANSTDSLAAQAPDLEPFIVDNSPNSTDFQALSPEDAAWLAAFANFVQIKWSRSTTKM